MNCQVNLVQLPRRYILMTLVVLSSEVLVIPDTKCTITQLYVSHVENTHIKVSVWRYKYYDVSISHVPKRRVTGGRKKNVRAKHLINDMHFVPLTFEWVFKPHFTWFKLCNFFPYFYAVTSEQNKDSLGWMNKCHSPQRQVWNVR